MAARRSPAPRWD